ncbi:MULTISPECIES: ABC transporter permease [Actinomycetes]|uniref:ABC transporter permease n=2 Tax=Actinomycetes TaxID=1760 RepID=A0ABP6LXM3_9MICC
MRTLDVTRTALGNTMRSKLRTFLTVIAIVIGAFTLAVTTGLAAGVNQTIEDMVDGYGEQDQIYVMQASAMGQGEDTGPGPQEYDPDTAGQQSEFGQAMLTEEDIETIEGIDGITNVDPIFFVSPDYLEAPDGGQYLLSELGLPADAAGMELVAGEAPGRDSMEITVPETWLAIFDDAADDYEDVDPESVLGETVELGISDMVRESHTVEAEVVGVSVQNLAGIGGSPMPSHALNDELYEIQSSGLDVEQDDAFVQAAADVEDMEAYEDSIKEALQEEGLVGLTVEDFMGIIQTVIDAIAWVLYGFAVIALIAASFGIVNTLLMSVQERTREIGLMKALGMSGGRIFGLFSMEAVMIGLLGSLIGVGGGVLTGVVANALLTGSGGPLGDVGGLILYAVSPVAILSITALVVGIAFLAGTLPAARAAKKDPIEALRYE